MSKKNLTAVPFADVRTLVETSGLPTRELSSYLYVGYKGGVQVAFAKGKNMGRAFVYRATPTGDAFTRYSDEERKEQRLGAITAELDLSRDEDSVRAAINEMIALVAAAEPPAPKPEPKPRKPRAPKAEAAAAPEAAPENQAS